MTPIENEGFSDFIRALYILEMTGQLMLRDLKLFQALLVEGFSPDKAAFNFEFQWSTGFVL